MAKINEFEINGFKAFPSFFSLKLDGKNLLMYGENGSGKSSIYYALHCLFNSYRKPDSGKKYFDSSNPQNLINKNFVAQEDANKPYVAVNWLDDSGNLNSSSISDDGCKELGKLAELDTCFINHKLLFSFFNFTNSIDINLFPVFQREILPYEIIDEYSENMSSIYEKILKDSHSLSNTSSSKDIDEFIKSFNTNLEQIIGNVNIGASDIYNNNFKEEGESELQIVLSYPELNPQPDIFLNGFRLKWDYPLVVDNLGKLVRANNKSIIQPIIGIEIKENGKQIDKPHTYFNEAKLTAIALSIRFALLNLNNPKEGSFLALDDMLISLDMSNRTKIVDFLLKISDKYKIYLFTHDRVFFEYFKERIIYNNKSKVLPQNEGWSFKELYKGDSLTNNPKEFNSDSDIARALKHYKDFDYPAAANYLRKAVETMITELFPPKLSKKNDGSKQEKLRNVLDSSFDFFSKIPEFDKTDLSRLISNLNLLMNPLSHKSTETNVYKTELHEIFAIIERLGLQIQELDIKEILPREAKVYLSIQENEHIVQKYEIELQQELYTYIIAGTKKILQPDSKSTRSCTINDGIEGEYLKNQHFKGDLEKVCKDINKYKNKEYENNYLNLYKDKRGNLLSNLI